MIKRFIHLLVPIFMFFGVSGQEIQKSKVLELNKYTHDFGIIKQENGAVNYTFLLVNRSKQEIEIVDVVPECSCTEPSWTQERIGLDQNGTISVGFKADHYPGEFEKMVDVYTTQDTFQLKIMGKVLPRPLSDIEKEFPASFGKIRFKDDVLGLKTVFDNKVFEKEFILFNDSTAPITNLSFTDLPPYIQIIVEDTIPAKSQTKITVMYDPILLNDYGYINDYVKLNNDKKIHDFLIMANVTPYIPNYSDKELLLAPKIVVDSNKTLAMGTINTDSRYTREVTVANHGQKDLKLLKVKSSCSCIVSDMSEVLVIKPNQDRKVTIYFDTTERMGRTKKNVYFYSNDPNKPAFILKITAQIK